MGCSSSKADPKREKVLRKFRMFCFTEGEVDQFQKKFEKMDVDKRGTVDIDEFVVTLRLESSSFIERVFQIFSEDGTSLDFYHYVVSMWNFATLGELTLVQFAFDIYDRSDTGVLNEDDIASMLNDLYGKGKANAQMKEKVKRELAEFGGSISLDQFGAFCKSHGSLLFPAFRVQNTLQEKIMGRSFWKKHSKRHIKMKSGEFVSVGRYKELKLHADDALADAQQISTFSTSKSKKSSTRDGAENDKSGSKKKKKKEGDRNSNNKKPKKAPEEAFSSVGV